TFTGHCSCSENARPTNGNDNHTFPTFPFICRSTCTPPRTSCTPTSTSPETAATSTANISHSRPPGPPALTPGSNVTPATPSPNAPKDAPPHAITTTIIKVPNRIHPL